MFNPSRHCLLVQQRSGHRPPMALGDCKGTASVIKAGKQLVFLEARLWGADSRLAVHATATVAVPSR
jgi:acyl-coenzyme A thioesterase PaaI-like protein